MNRFVFGNHKFRIVIFFMIPTYFNKLVRTLISRIMLLKIIQLTCCEI